MADGSESGAGPGRSPAAGGEDQAEPLDGSILMTRLALGDEVALAALVRARASQLNALAYSYTRSHADAEEIVSAAFLALWQAAPNWPAGSTTVLPWLRKVTINRCVDYARSGRLLRLFDRAVDPDDVAGEQLDQTSELAARQELMRTQQDIARLPARQRGAILLAAQADYSAAQIADALGISEGAAQQLLVRARRTLREKRRARASTDGKGR